MIEIVTHLDPQFSGRRPPFVNACGRWLFEHMLRSASLGSLVIEFGFRTLSFGDPESRSPAHMSVLDESLFYDVVAAGELGLGMGYMSGKWESPAPADVLLFFCLNENKFRGVLRPAARALPLSRSVRRAIVVNQRPDRRTASVGLAYDVGDDFFRMMLGPSMLFTCAIWDSAADSLEAAQARKMSIVLQKLQVAAGQRVLDLGCGWGTFTDFVARETGADVLGIALSRSQIAHAQLSHPRRAFLYCDFMDLNAKFDRIVSVGMFEHVGRENMAAFMRRLAESLLPGGRIVLHGIVYNDGIFFSDGNADKYPTFPQLLMPGTDTVTSGQIISCALSAGLRVVHTESYGVHYARTALAWSKNLEDNRDAIVRRYGERLFRAYRYAWALMYATMETGLNLMHFVLEHRDL